MELNTFIALLTLIVVLGGGAFGLLWAKVNALDNRLSDERVKSAERFVTVEELDRRLDQSLKPLVKQMTRVEEQNERVLNLLVSGDRGYHREVSHG